MRAYSFMFGDLQNDQANLLPQSPDTVKHLQNLGSTMIDPGTGDAGDGDIPSAYTYFGQFVDHDITLEGSPFGPVGLFSPHMVPLSPDKIRQLNNLRTPTLDLDSVYGPTSPPDQDPPHDRTYPDKMQIGTVTPPGLSVVRRRGSLRVRLKGDDNDLPRKPRDRQPHNNRQDRAALVGDPRNDENLIVAQLHVAFLKAHNALVDQGETFDQARRLLRQHYQHIVIHDFLRRVADPEIVDRILQQGNRVYNPPPGRFFLPLEFTVAAYRFGHSMVRSKYDINLNFNKEFRDSPGPASVSDLFAFTAFSGDLGPPADVETPTLPDKWIIEWHRFADTLDTKAANKARRINTKLSEGLFNLPGLHGSHPRGVSKAVLAERNLLRGYRLRMPTGQAIARRLGLPALTSAQIKEAADDRKQVQALAEGGFLNRTPLWYYLLAEAAHRSFGKGQRLGPVGSTIVAEVLIGLIRRSEDSILSTPGWQPSLPAAQPGRFELADLLRFAGVLPRTYKTRDGDSLCSIAADRLGDASRWTEIFVLNRDDIRRRDMIPVGQVLLLPGDTSANTRPVLHTFQAADPAEGIAGETLKGLALKFLGNLFRETEIRDLNADVVDDDPGSTLQPPPGTQLVILPP